MRQQLAVLNQVCKAQLGEAARLAGPEPLARAADPQVLLRDLEAAVASLEHREAPRRLLAPGLRHEQRKTGLLSAPYPSAQLVELGEAEALGVLHHQQRGSVHVEANLDHAGRHEDPYLPGAEARHDPAPLGRVQPAVHERERDCRERLAHSFEATSRIL